MISDVQGLPVKISYSLEAFLDLFPEDGILLLLHSIQRDSVRCPTMDQECLSSRQPFVSIAKFPSVMSLLPPFADKMRLSVTTKDIKIIFDQKVG